MVNRAGLVLFGCLILGGCAIYKQEFDCKAGKGVGCKSISEVNELVNKGTLSKKDKLLPAFESIATREDDSRLRIFVMPYTDVNGVRHEGKYLE